MNDAILSEVTPPKKEGFSICIPIYNQDVTKLVTELRRQSLRSGIPFEIILIDDASYLFQKENKALGKFPDVSYTCLPVNIGRSAIRNRLAETANFPHLIFMDCDTLPSSNQFIHNYLKQRDKEVVIGGYKYADESPDDKEHLLRWKYGKTREERSVAERSTHPHQSFSTFNFMIRKEVLLRIRFDETLKGYGHEDTLLGWELKKAGIPITHIDNPLLHVHPDTGREFFYKNMVGTKNLWSIYQKMEEGERDVFAKDVKSLNCYLKLKKWGVANFTVGLLYHFYEQMENNLLSQRPIIRLLDLFKLMWLAVADNTTKTVRPKS